MWRHQIDLFLDEYHVIAPDLRGFGDSSGSDDTTMAQMADDLAIVLDELGVQQPVVFCGLSMGGYVAWQFWRRHRDKLAALILCDTRAAADSKEMARARQMTAERVLVDGPSELSETMLTKLFAADTLEKQPDVVQAIRQTILRTSPMGIAAALRAMAQRPDVTSWLPEIDVPSLVVCGAQDQISGPSEMKELASALPRAQFTVIDEAGHMSPLEQPVRVNRAIQQFLRSVLK